MQDFEVSCIGTFEYETSGLHSDAEKTKNKKQKTSLESMWYKQIW